MGKSKQTTSYVPLLVGITLLIGVVVFVPKAGSIDDSLRAVAKADIKVVLAAAGLMLGTYFAAALALYNLSLRPVKFYPTLLVQFASGFVGKLAPSGIGGFALNTRYLMMQRHKAVTASAVMLMNGLLGFAGHAVILLSVFWMGGNKWSDSLRTSSSIYVWVLAMTIVFILMLSIIFKRLLGHHLKRAASQLHAAGGFYLSHPSRVAKAFIGTSLVTLFFAGALYLCAAALGVSLSPLQILLVYTAGAVGITLTPTPGGIGGAEAALTAGLVTVGIEAAAALPVVLLYRLVSYWLPILPGFLFFRYCLRQKYI